MDSKKKTVLVNVIGFLITASFVIGTFAFYDNSKGLSLYQTRDLTSVEARLDGLYRNLQLVDTVEFDLTDTEKVLIYSGVSDATSVVFSLPESNNSIHYYFQLTDPDGLTEEKEGVLNRGRGIEFELCKGVQYQFSCSTAAKTGEEAEGAQETSGVIHIYTKG